MDCHCKNPLCEEALVNYLVRLAPLHAQHYLGGSEVSTHGLLVALRWALQNSSPLSMDLSQHLSLINPQEYPEMIFLLLSLILRRRHLSLWRAMCALPSWRFFLEGWIGDVLREEWEEALCIYLGALQESPRDLAYWLSQEKNPRLRAHLQNFCPM